MCLIFMMSHLDSVKSWYLTGELFTTIKTASYDVDSTIDEKLKQYDAPELSNQLKLIRKFAHFIEYFVLFLLVYHVVTYYQSMKYAIITSILLCIAFAGLDEFHQSFVPGRAARLTDVMIDSFGVLTGFALVTLTSRLRKAHTNEN